jgi:hypothetical protein
MENYPTVALILRHGKALAMGIAALIPIIVLVLLANGWSWWLLPAGLVVGAVVFGLLMSYVEIIRIISDTLLPK